MFLCTLHSFCMKIEIGQLCFDNNKLSIKLLIKWQLLHVTVSLYLERDVVVEFFKYNFSARTPTNQMALSAPY